MRASGILTGIKKFEGWYFKHQSGENTVAFIPGISSDGAFVQMLLPGEARYFKTSGLSVKEGTIYTGDCRFSTNGCSVKLPGVEGQIRYGEVTPLRSDIMGPFRFFPMECRHGVISMSHSLAGNLKTDGKNYDFDGGTGYIEKDSGISFPTYYQWLQCNDFDEPCSVMVSIARIPFLGMSFNGCICAIIYRDREYRLATYNGVRIISAEESQIRLSQKNLKLCVNISPVEDGHLLKSPVKGLMTGTIRERANAKIRIKLSDNDKTVFDLCSLHAAYEYVN